MSSKRTPKNIAFMSSRHKRRLRENILKGLQNACLTNNPSGNYSTGSIFSTTQTVSSTLSISQISSDTNLTLDSSLISIATSSVSATSTPPISIPVPGPADIFGNMNNHLYGSSSPTNNFDTDSESECDCLECINASNSNSLEMSSNLVDDLRSWVTECNIALNHTSKLLKILISHNINVPSDARTLLKTPRYVNCDEMESGEYCHIGIESSILQCLKVLPNEVLVPSELKLNINIDGLPLSKSSGSQLWPILGWFVPHTFEQYSFYPFVIGVYHGHTKPKDVNHFLRKFVNEFNSLQQIGFIWKNENIKIKFNVLICDAPAKAFILCVKGHTGYHGCSKCIQEGEFINCLTFPELGCALRTDESFKAKQD